MSDITRNSHYVPQATLKRWSDDGIHVHAYRILVSHANVPEWLKQPIKGVTRQTDLYTTLEGDEESDKFEKQITRAYEEPRQDAIEKLLAKQRMTPLDWNRIAKFVALQQMRTPLFFLEFVKRLNDQIPSILAQVVKDYEERQEEHPAPNITAQAHGSNPSNHLGDNHPVLTLNYFRPDLYDFEAGWGRKGSEFILPVSPRVAVCAQVGTNNHGPRNVTVQQTRGIQRFMAERALRWIIARRGAGEWVSSVRPRTVNAEVYAREQEAWRSWHSSHTESETEFRAGKKP